MKKIWKFFAKYPILVTFVIVISSFGYAINEVNKVAVVAKKTVEQREIDSIIGGRANCEAINTSTRKLIQVVVVATSGAIGIDYTAIPEFQALDQATKTFFVALRLRSKTVGNVQAREEFLRGLDIRDCSAEYPFPSPNP